MMGPEAVRGADSGPKLAMAHLTGESRFKLHPLGPEQDDADHKPHSSQDSPRSPLTLTTEFSGPDHRSCRWMLQPDRHSEAPPKVPPLTEQSEGKVDQVDPHVSEVWARLAAR